MQGMKNSTLYHKPCITKKGDEAVTLYVFHYVSQGNSAPLHPVDPKPAVQHHSTLLVAELKAGGYFLIWHSRGAAIVKPLLPTSYFSDTGREALKHYLKPCLPCQLIVSTLRFATLLCHPVWGGVFDYFVTLKRNYSEFRKNLKK